MTSHPSSSHPIPPDPNGEGRRTAPDSTPPSSSSVDRPEIKYDVFVSFRGPDVRSTFLSHLLQELDREKFVYFVDDQNLQPGDEISSTLLDAIKKSEISLVLFSEDYASSKWCLEELEQIIQCMESQNQIILPVFYKVDPSTVRHQNEKYNDAFHKLGERFDDDKLQKWKAALKRASDLSGFDSSKYNTEATFIKKIVERVKKLMKTTSQNENDLEGFVGIHKHIQYLETKLDTKSAIGICGIEGMGKTTIAEILYNRLRDKYESSHLLYVKEELDKGKSMRDLKKDLLAKLSGQEVDDVTHSGIPEHVDRTLRRKKVLLVLDDITDIDQLENLIGGCVKFGSSSRIIMTSKNKQVLQKCDEIYEVKGLNPEDALQLFKKCLEMAKGKEECLHKSCSIEKQELCELSKMVVDCAKGVPLVIKVLGYDLSTAKSKLEWKSKLEKLKEKPDPKIQEVLEIRYDGLNDEHKDIFVYLACFFRYEYKEDCIRLLNACGYNTIDGLRVLQDKAFITISNGGCISMHDLIQDMGYEVVRKRASNNLGRHSHLWDANDICEVFTEQLGTCTIQGIRLNTQQLEKDLRLKPQAFAGMNNLKILIVKYQLEDRSNTMYANIYPPKEGFESLPKELRSLYWEGYPLESFPLRCRLNKLVELSLPFSSLKRLWDGVQEFPSLKVINLRESWNLIELPDLSKTPKLESIILRNCRRLFSLSRPRKRRSLYHVPLWPCSSPPTSNLLYMLPSLQDLDLSMCTSICELPDNIGLCLPSLHSLVISMTDVKGLPKSITHLAKLRSLDVFSCKSLKNIPKLPPSIESLTADKCNSLEELQFSSNFMHLSRQKEGPYIRLQGCNQLAKHTLEEVAMHYKHSVQLLMSTSRKNNNALLYFSGSQVPECLRNSCATHGSVLDPPLNLSFHSEAIGFIFHFHVHSRHFYHFNLTIKCHIELSNVAKVEFESSGTGLLPQHGIFSGDVVFLCYKGSLSLKIVEALSKIKASATTDNGHIKVWFELFTKNGEERGGRSELNDLSDLKEWGVYCITSSEPQNHLAL